MHGKIHSTISYMKHRLLARAGGHGVHSPFVYSLCENVFYNRAAFYEFTHLEDVRQKLLADHTVIDTGHFGAGSRTFRNESRRVSQVAARGISSQKQSQQLFRLANFIGASTCVELGTSLGLTTLYLARQNLSGKVITLEGSPALCAYAKKLAEADGIVNIEFVNAAFGDVLPEIVQRVACTHENETTLIYIDGDHSFTSTMKYFEMLQPLARGHNVFVFDDLYWSKGMTAAWKQISEHPGVSLAIDTFYTGFVFFNPGFRGKSVLRLLV